MRWAMAALRVGEFAVSVARVNLILDSRAKPLSASRTWPTLSQPCSAQTVAFCTVTPKVGAGS